MRAPVLSNLIRSSPTSASFSISNQITADVYEISYYTNIGNSFDQVPHKHSCVVLQCISFAFVEQPRKNLPN